MLYDIMYKVVEDDGSGLELHLVTRDRQAAMIKLQDLADDLS